MELKYQNEDDLAGEIIKHGSPSTSPEQGKHEDEIGQPHQMIADIDQEKDHPKTELAVQQQRLRDIQELDHQKKQYGQLMTEQHVSRSLSPTDESEDVS